MQNFFRLSLKRTYAIKIGEVKYTPKVFSGPGLATNFLNYIEQESKLKVIENAAICYGNQCDFAARFKLQIPISLLNENYLEMLETIDNIEHTVDNEMLVIVGEGPLCKNSREAKVNSRWILMDKLFPLYSKFLKLPKFYANSLYLPSKEIVLKMRKSEPFYEALPDPTKTVEKLEKREFLYKTSFSVDRPMKLENYEFDETVGIPFRDDTYLVRRENTKTRFINTKPTSSLNSTLSIFKSYKEIVQSIEENQVTIINAATGTGKTTQIPQYIIEYAVVYFRSFRDSEFKPKIGISQPRRIAAISISKRIAMERNEVVGMDSIVGYMVRFDSKPPANNSGGSITFYTTGLLEKVTALDPYLSKYTHLILDEIHQRDIHSDILLLAAKRIMLNRPDFKVILMSASMNAVDLECYFSDFKRKIVQIEGIRYPVEEYYLEDVLKMTKGYEVRGCENEDWEQETIYEELNSLEAAKEEAHFGISSVALQRIPNMTIVKLIEHIYKTESKGSILVFVPGIGEINDLTNLLLLNPISSKFEIFQLHSSIPKFDDIFKVGSRKLIIATNIAESSITIPDVKFIIDCGKQRMKYYRPIDRFNIFTTCYISNSNLIQRKGRVGRCEPGKYYTLLSKQRQLEVDVIPELLRSSLGETILHLKKMHFADDVRFVLQNVLSPPTSQSVDYSINELKHLGALTENEDLTHLGTLMSHFPLPPNYSKMLIFAAFLARNQGRNHSFESPLLTKDLVSSSLKNADVANLDGSSVLENILIFLAMQSSKDQLFAVKRINEAAFGKLMLTLSKATWSDHIAMINLYKKYAITPPNDQKEFCSLHHLSYHGMQHAIQVKKQLAQLVNQHVFSKQQSNPTHHFNQPEIYFSQNTELCLLKLALLIGFYPNVAIIRDSSGENRVPKLRNPSCKRFNVSKTSILHYNTKFPSRLVAYDEAIKIGASIISRCTLINSKLLILVAKMESTDVGIVLDDFIRIKVDQELKDQIFMLRNMFDRWIHHRAQNIEGPSDLAFIQMLLDFVNHLKNLEK